MFGKPNSYSIGTETPPAPEQPSMQALPKKRLGKKLYVLAAVIAIAVISIVLLIPKGGAIIPLNVNYVVGEKMTYNTTVTVTGEFSYQNLSTTTPLPTGPITQTTSMNSSIEVIDFDGESYTLNNTMTVALGQNPSSIWFLQKVNKTGYTTSVLLNIGSTQISSNVSDSGYNPLGGYNPYLSSFLNRSEVRVGDTWAVPLPPMNNSVVQMTGELMMTFKGFQDLTVPAGTYRVFRVDLTSHDLTMHINSPQNAGINLAITANMNINGQMYMESGTLRQIKSAVQEDISYESTMMNFTMGMKMDMTLVEHTIPK